MPMRANGIHSGTQRMATLLLVSEDKKYQFQVLPDEFPGVKSGDVVMVFLNVLKIDIEELPEGFVPPTSLILPN